MSKRIHIANEKSKEVGKRVRELRTSLSITQKALGKESLLSQNHISNIEKGIENVSDDAIARLSVALNTSFEYLKNGNVVSERKLAKKVAKANAPRNTQCDGQMTFFDLGWA